MRSTWLLVSLILAAGSGPTTHCVADDAESDASITREVDPFIGTGGHGHTYPGAVLPFGMVQLSPDTFNQGWDWCSGYHYSDTSIMGFSHTHLSGTGSSDYGDILFMPTTGGLQFEPGTREAPDAGYRSRFSHEQESAEAGYYSVRLDDYDIQVELTVTKHVGIHRYAFPDAKPANVIIDLTHFIDRTEILESELEIISSTKLRGYLRKRGWAADRRVYFVAEFSRAFDESGIVRDNGLLDDVNQATGTNLKAHVTWLAGDARQVTVKVAISAVDYEGAEKNLAAEAPEWQFDAFRQAATTAWQEQLSSITIGGGTPAQRRIFYTALYHSCLAPHLYSDVDGRYRGMDQRIHKAPQHGHYTVFSLWDTFRTLHPLMTVIEPERTNAFIVSMLDMHQQTGRLPKWELASNETWAMIGYHAVSVIADAWNKGIRGFDADQALDAMTATSSADFREMQSYRRLGFVANDEADRSASRSVEFPYDDWCIARMAESLRRDELRHEYDHRALFHRNIFDEQAGFVRGRESDGSWRGDFEPDDLSGDFVEGNSWHYTWFAPHDVYGLIERMGGDATFVERLDELFTTQGREHVDVSGLIGQYAHGNEPSHSFAYLYNYAGYPWKTQQRVSQIVRTLYTDRPDGICGNDDCGQMSAWYVLSALGLYPACPGQPIYVIGSPVFPKASIRVGDGTEFEIHADDVSDENIYVQSAELNGEPYDKSYIDHADLLRGGLLRLQMGSAPNKNWATSHENRPPAATLHPPLSVPTELSSSKLVPQPQADPAYRDFSGQLRVASAGITTFRQGHDVGRCEIRIGPETWIKQPMAAGRLEVGTYPVIVRVRYPKFTDDLGIHVRMSGDDGYSSLESHLVPPEKWLPAAELQSPDDGSIFLHPRRLKNLSLATGKTVTCSGDTQYPHRPDNVVDADPSNQSGWHCSSSPSWIQVDLGAMHQIDRLALYTYHDGRRIYRYTIELSDDGKHFEQVVDQRRNKTPSTEEPFVHQISPGEARYVRLNMLSNTANAGVHVNELQVFGTPSH